MTFYEQIRVQLWWLTVPVTLVCSECDTIQLFITVK